MFRSLAICSPLLTAYPSITDRFGFRNQPLEPLKEILPILIILKYGSSLNPPNNDMMQSPWGV